MSDEAARSRPHLLAIAAGAVLLSVTSAWQPARAQSQAWVPSKGHGSVSVAYQHLYIEWHSQSLGNKVRPGDMTIRTVFLNLDYGLTDRLALNVGMPYTSNKFVEKRPGGAHDPGNLTDNHGQAFIDDGRYHGSWQDWNIGLRYQWRSEPWAITPFLSYSQPSRDYSTFAHAAPAMGLWRVQAGMGVGRRFSPPLQNIYFQGGYGYSYMEKVDRRVNHSTLSLELGYFVTPKLTARVVVVGQKTHNGYDFPQDFPDRTDDHFFHHDQNLRNDFVNLGAGINYQFNERYALFANYGHTVWGENTHLIDYAITVGISRGF